MKTVALVLFGLLILGSCFAMMAAIAIVSYQAKLNESILVLALIKIIGENDNA